MLIICKISTNAKTVVKQIYEESEHVKNQEKDIVVEMKSGPAAYCKRKDKDENN